MADDKLPLVTVRGAGDDHKVVLWEKHEAHPEGEAFVVNEDKGVEVATTAEVKRLLADGTLIKGGAAKEETPPETVAVAPKAFVKGRE